MKKFRSRTLPFSLELHMLILLTFCYSLTSLAQTNDNCADATELTVSTSCNTLIFSNENATEEDTTVAKTPSCGIFTGGDIWFTLVMPASGALRIETDNQVGTVPHVMTFYSGICGSFTEELCIALDRQRTILRPDLAGQTLYLRMFNYASTNTGGSSFELCVSEPKIPINDNCASATEIPVDEICSLRSYTNAFATSEDTSVAPIPSCGQYTGGDVWFKTVIPEPGIVRIEVPRSVALYSGNCGSLQEIFCNQLDKAEIYSDSSWAGEEIFIRVFSYASEEGSDFDMCLFSPELPVNDNCASAIEIPEGETCNLQMYTNRYATSEDTSVAPIPSCGQFAGGDVWFKTVVPQSGVIRLEVERSAAIYAGVCGSFQEIFCKQLNDEVIFQDQTRIGEEVYIRVYSYANEEGNDFNICLFNPELPVNDNCASAIEIPVSPDCNPETFSNVFATSENSVAPIPSCGQYRGGDVWFKVTVPSSGRVNFETNSNSNSMVLYSGTCNSMTEISCHQLSDKALFNNSSLASQEIYLRMFNYDSEEGKSFELCIYEPSCEDTAVDAGIYTICEGDQLIFGSQNLTQPGTYDETFITQEGCDSTVSLTIQTSPIYQWTDSVHLCEGEDYTFPDGTVQNDITENLSYTSFLTSTHNCDSIITTEIEIDTVDISIEIDGTSLIALAENATFQWIDCSNGNFIIPGEINQIFTSSENGEYAVIVTQNGCSETSDCYEVLLTAIENTNSPEVMLYPNPSAGDLYIQMDKEYDFISIDIINIQGQKLLDRKYYNQSSIQMELSGLTPGTYFALIDTKKEFTIARIIRY